MDRLTNLIIETPSPEFKKQDSLVKRSCSEGSNHARGIVIALLVCPRKSRVHLFKQPRRPSTSYHPQIVASLAGRSLHGARAKLQNASAAFRPAMFVPAASHGSNCGCKETTVAGPETQQGLGNNNEATGRKGMLKISLRLLT